MARQGAEEDGSRSSIRLSPRRGKDGEKKRKQTRGKRAQGSDGDAIVDRSVSTSVVVGGPENVQPARNGRLQAKTRLFTAPLR